MACVIGYLLDKGPAGVTHLRRLALVTLGEHLWSPSLGVFPESCVVGVKRVVALLRGAAITHAQEEQLRSRPARALVLARIRELLVKVRIGRRVPHLELRRVPRPQGGVGVVPPRIAARGLGVPVLESWGTPQVLPGLDDQRGRLGDDRPVVGRVQPSHPAELFQEVVDRVQGPSLVPEPRQVLEFDPLGIVEHKVLVGVVSSHEIDRAFPESDRVLLGL